ncbi:MAG TPA: helix-turn-helix domain-containing protein [Blastocatellia bacterium]|nr:helix-turn-helix domain-containing protein [Blastocatellia bacterium]
MKSSLTTRNEAEIGLISLDEAASLLGVDESTIRKNLCGFSFTKIRLGRRVVIPRAEVVAHIERLIEEARQQAEEQKARARRNLRVIQGTAR